MTISTAALTADQWAGLLAANLSETEPGWTCQPSAQHERRCVAYLIGPGKDERIRLEVAYDDEQGTPVGTLWTDVDFGPLARFAQPTGTTGTTTPTDDREQLITALQTEIIPTMRVALRACYAKRDQAAIADAHRAAIMAEICQRLELDPERTAKEPRVYFGRRDSKIVGRFTPHRDGVAFDLDVSYPEALALADYLTQRRRSLGEAPAPDDCDGPAPDAFDDIPPF